MTTPSEQIQIQNNRSILILSSDLRLGLSKDLFIVGLPVNILNSLQPFSIFTTLNLEGFDGQAM